MDHHYKPLCNNTNGSLSTQSYQRDTSIRLIRTVIFFALVLYKKKKKNCIPFVFPILFFKPFLSFLLICHEVWPELLFICRPGWSFFHSLSFTAVDFCMVCASACLSVLVTYLHKGGTREGWGFGERIGWKLFFPPLFLVSTQTDWCSWCPTDVLFTCLKMEWKKNDFWIFYNNSKKVI